MAKISHPLLTLIASGTDRELAKYVEFLKEEPGKRADRSSRTITSARLMASSNAASEWTDCFDTTTDAPLDAVAPNRSIHH